MPVEGFKLAAGRGSGMGSLGVFFFLRVSTMADNTAVRVAELCAQFVNTYGHPRVVLPDGLYTLMALCADAPFARLGEARTGNIDGR